MLQPSNLRLKRRISDRREVTCQRLVTLLQTRAGFQSQDHLPRLEAPCSRTSPKLTTPTLKASTAFLRTTLSPDHRKGPNHQWTLMSTPSKTIQDPERQALRCHFVVTHSLTRIAPISSTIRNTSHLTTATTSKLASTQDKNPHPIDHRSHTTRTNTADLGQLGQTPPEKVKKSAAPPVLPVFSYHYATHLIINTTLAGVAQSVERVALITAKRSTSRSWVRAPPSAIPILQAHQSSCFFAFWSGQPLGQSSEGLRRWLSEGDGCGILVWLF
jgi:hypothetical protein